MQDNKKVVISVLLIVMMSMTGCASTLPAVAGANNSKSHILYEHRTPIQKTAIYEAAKAGVLGELGFPTNKIWENAGEISLGAADIVKAITKLGGFPYSIIPQVISGVFKGITQMKEETSDQEVSKLYYTDGMAKMSATLPDHAVINTEWYESATLIPAPIIVTPEPTKE